MIYLINKYPAAVNIETLDVQDLNDFVWNIVRYKDGFVVGYDGDDYFKDTYLNIDLNSKHVLLKNTGLFYINDTTFDVFYMLLNIITNSWTDDIWEELTELFNMRFNVDDFILPGEKQYVV